MREQIRAGFIKPTVPSTAPIEQQRREWEEQATRQALPPGVRATLLPAGASGLLLTPERAPDDALIIHAHGGGFVSGSSMTHRVFGAHLALAARMRVFLVDYRRAPEHAFPAARDDLIAAYGWAMAHGYPASRIVIAGDSAGGHVALSAVLAALDQRMPPPAGVVLLSPWLDLAQRGESMRTRARADLLVLQADLQQCAAHYLGGRAATDGSADLLAADFSRLPPILVHVGDDEVLLSDSLRLAKRARAAGGTVEIKVWPGLWHVFHLWAPKLPEANDAIAQIGDFVRAAVSR